MVAAPMKKSQGTSGRFSGLAHQYHVVHTHVVYDGDRAVTLHLRLVV